MLAEEGYEVRGFDLNSAPYSSKPQLESFIQGDLRTMSDVDKACSGMDTVFHVASFNSLGDLLLLEFSSL